MLQLIFSDRCVEYEDFIDDFSTAVVAKLREREILAKDIISQRQAYKLFGQGNVSRWLRQRRLEPVSKRPGKVEYRVSDLLILQQRKQDYFQ